MIRLPAIIAILALPPSLHAQTASFVGDWHGTSICVKEDWNASCNDEQIVYHVVPAKAGGKTLTLHAYKLVGGKPDWMGDIDFTPDSLPDHWFGEFSNSRVHIRWVFAVSGNTLTGQLLIYPDLRVGRNVAATRDSPKPN